MDDTENDFYTEDGGEPGYTEDGGGDDPFAHIPEGHWVRDPEWIQFVDKFVTAITDDPAAIETWYSEFAADKGLRGLTEAQQEKAAKLMSKELHEQATKFLRAGNEERQQQR